LHPPEARMSASSKPKRIKGIGRVAFIAHLAEITADLVP